jgi:drug/metabolite transporter (DMT)-like permease
MRLLYVAIALTIAGNVVYHVSQKSIPAGVHPVVSVIVSWITAIVVSLLVLPFIPLRGSVMSEVARLNWTSFVVGAAIVAVEIGFLLAYRAGWNISLGAVTSNTAVGLILIPTGMLLFHERMTLTHAIGIVFCLIGLVLVTR